MRRKILSLLLVLALAVSFAACGRDSNKAKGCDINIASLKGPTSIGLVKLFDDSDNGKTVNKYNYSIYGTADEISTGIIKGDLDAAAVPCNLASVLYNKSDGEIVIAGVNTLGVIYILEKGVEISSVADLKGHTIYTTGQGTTPEYTLRYLLSAGGLNPDTDVTIEFRSEAAEVVSAVSQLDSAVMMLPQPYVTVAQGSDENIRVALDVTAEWERLDKDSTVVTGVLIARKSFIDEHPDEFEAFLSEYGTSAAFANDNVEETAQLVEKFDIFKAAVAQKAIPQCNVTFITGNEMRSKVLSYLTVLFDANPASVGGKLPDENIFYGAE
ncbi:MAG: ABC transporter substrate-binding protein [Butyrivibrio sp.]|nr:ABC transporter substrate-binding protein [Butyrivibrio sp.]